MYIEFEGGAVNYIKSHLKVLRKSVILSRENGFKILLKAGCGSACL